MSGRLHRATDEIKKRAILRSINGGYVLNVELADKKLTALLPTDDTSTLEANGLKTTGAIKLKIEHTGGKPPQILEIREGELD